MSRVAANRTLGASAVRCGAATLAGAEDPPQGADNLKFELSALRGPHSLRAGAVDGQPKWQRTSGSCKQAAAG